MEYRKANIEIKSSSSDGSRFSGLASVYHVLDEQNDIVAPGAFAKTLDDFMKFGVIKSQHMTTIGKPTKVEDRVDGLAIEAMISDTTQGRDDMVLLRDGVIKTLSIGYQTRKSEPLATMSEVVSYWAKAGYAPSQDEIMRANFGGRLLTEVTLKEVSLVDFPANKLATITSVKRGNQIALKDMLTEARRQIVNLKSGRVLSDSNRKRLKSLADGMRMALADLDTLLSETDYDEKEKQERIELLRKELSSLQI